MVVLGLLDLDCCCGYLNSLGDVVIGDSVGFVLDVLFKRLELKNVWNVGFGFFFYNKKFIIFFLFWRK